jgi:S1 RNA binding domain protein
MPPEIGQVVEVKVLRLMPFGALVELGEGVTGLIHISEIAHEFIRNVGEYLTPGDVVQAKIIGLREPGKYQLSLKALTEPSPESVPTRRPVTPELEGKLSRFMKEAQERQSDLKKRREGKKGKKT